MSDPENGAIYREDGFPVYLVECWRCGERYERKSCMGVPCPDCDGQGSSVVEPEGKQDDMCPRHWLLDGTRDGSCAGCLGADVPDGRGAVMVTENNGVTFVGDLGETPVATPALLGPCSEFAATGQIEPGELIAAFPAGDVESVELNSALERQSTLAEAGQ